MARKGIYLINLPPITNRRVNSSSYSIPPGTSGYVLSSNGASAAPTWKDPNTLVSINAIPLIPSSIPGKSYKGSACFP